MLIIQCGNCQEVIARDRGPGGLSTKQIQIAVKEGKYNCPHCGVKLTLKDFGLGCAKV